MATDVKETPKVIAGWDDSLSNDIKLVCKRGENTAVEILSGKEWYFAIKKEDGNKLGKSFFKEFDKDRHEKDKVITKIVVKGEYLLIYCQWTSRDLRTSKLISELKKRNIEVYESDLSRTKRFMVDSKAPIADKLNILYFDIETDDSRKAGIEIGKDQILSWAAYNNKGQHWYRVAAKTADGEKVLLQQFLKLLDKHDVFVGWNSLKFDWPYIQARMDLHGIRYSWRKKIHIDLMKRSIKMYSYEMDKIGLMGFALNEVARVFLGEAKVSHTEGIKEMYDNNPELLKEYNLKDAELLMKLDAKLGIIDLMINECVWTGTTLDRFYVGELLDNYMLRKSKELGEYLYSRPTQEEAERNKNTWIIGGYVKPPVTGLYTDVRIFDFKSLYPSLIVSWNIGPDSMDREISAKGNANYKKFVGPDRKIEDVEFMEWFKFLKAQKKLLDPNDECFQTANNNFYRKDKISFISSLVKELLALREQMKKKLVGLQPGSPEYGSTRSSQAIVKELANSMYGVTGDRNSRYFDKGVAESITLTGQFMNKATSHIIEDLGYQVIYGDTDSIFAPIPEGTEDLEAFTKKVNIRLRESLSKYFKLKANIVSLEYEKAYRKMVMVDKKRYSGTMAMMNDKKTDILFSKGLEDVKKNTIKITRLKMRELIVMITKEDKELHDIQKWLLDLKQYVFESKDITVEDIRISTRLSKPTFKYISKSAHVILADKMIEKGLILQPSEDADSWGTRIDYVISTSHPKQTATHVDDFDGTWDKNYYWDTQIYAPIMRILQIVWPDENWEEHMMYYAEKQQKLLDKVKKKEEKEALAIIRAEKKKEREEARKLREAERERKKAEREAKKAAKQLKLPL